VQRPYVGITNHSGIGSLEWDRVKHPIHGIRGEKPKNKTHPYRPRVGHPAESKPAPLKNQSQGCGTRTENATPKGVWWVGRPA
jgi:hypothetical protein